jgi:hypothetical protein
MKALAQEYVWWPGMDEALECFASTCTMCQWIWKSVPVVVVVPWTWPQRKWERIHANFCHSEPDYHDDTCR